MGRPGTNSTPQGLDLQRLAFMPPPRFICDLLQIVLALTLTERYINYMDAAFANSQAPGKVGRRNEISKHTEGQFVVCGGSEQFLQATNAKTLTGAKVIASKTYQQAVGGKIEVAVVRGEQYEVVAVKHGYDKWQQG